MTTKSDTPDNGQTDTLCNVCPVRTELAAITATAEDYRIQACKPDDCKVQDNLKHEIEALQMQNSLFRKFIENVSTNYDCDSDGHKYGTGCRCCEANELLNPKIQGVES